MNAATRRCVSNRPTLAASVVFAGFMLGCILALPQFGWGGDATPSRLNTKLVSLSLFKNGLGFVIRQAEIPKGAASLLIDDLPAPAHGTFWVYSPNYPAGVRDVVAFEQDTTQRMDAISLAELVEANIGQTVDLRLNERETVHAKILSVAAPRAYEGTTVLRDRSADSGQLYPAETASLVLLQTESGTVALNRNSIQQITSVDGPLKTAIERKKRTVTLRVKTNIPEGQGRLIVEYLAKGIAWAPSCARPPITG